MTDQARGYKAHHPSVGRVTEYVANSEDRFRTFPLAANWALDSDRQVDSSKKVNAKGSWLLGWCLWRLHISTAHKRSCLSVK